MDLFAFFSSLGLKPQAVLTGCAAVIFGLLLFGLVGRFIFGKKSNLTYAISSSIGIVLMCTLVVALRYAGPQLAAFVAPMPFVQVSGNSLSLFDFSGADYTQISTQLLSMIILSFIFNTIDRWMPRPKNLFGWLFFRCLSVVLALFAHLLVSTLALRYVPAGLIVYAPVVLLAILVLMLLTGALKLLVGVLLSTVNPLIGALYTFFFASIVGKMITRAVITTAILAFLVAALKSLGITAIFIGAAALIAYVPFLILLVLVWYLVDRLL